MQFNTTSIKAWYKNYEASMLPYLELVVGMTLYVYYEDQALGLLGGLLIFIGGFEILRQAIKNTF